MRRVLITGATGFIGCRLAEALHARGVEVVALVRTWSAAARLARLPVRMVAGDLLDRRSVRRAARGCGVLFDCAADFRTGGAVLRRSIPTCARNVLDSGARRIVMLSTMAVHGFLPRPETATEEASPRYTGVPYCDGKIDAERMALSWHRRFGAPVTILRPTIVYGPYGAWTTRIVEAAGAGRLSLVDGGRGVCNALYVDNLVSAMIRAAESDRAVGEIFYVNDAAPVTWKEYLESHAGGSLPDAGRRPPLPTPGAFGRIRGRLSSINAQIEAGVHPVFRASWKHAVRDLLGPFERLARRAAFGESGERPAPSVPSASDWDVMSARVAFSIEKARRVFGYDPKIDFAAGMRITADWIRWAYEA